MKYIVYISILFLPLLVHAEGSMTLFEFPKQSQCRISGTGAICAILNESTEKALFCDGSINAVAADGQQLSELVKVNIGQNAFHYPSIINTKSNAPIVAAKTDLKCYYREDVREALKKN